MFSKLKLVRGVGIFTVKLTSFSWSWIEMLNDAQLSLCFKMKLKRSLGFQLIQHFEAEVRERHWNSHS